MAAAPDADAYDPRYLAGILFFNERAFFEAHEVWEDLWHVTAGPDRRYYQALIQCAVALFHLGNRNLRGALRLYHSSKNYLTPYHPRHQGLDLDLLAAGMHRCFAPWLETADPPPAAPPPDDALPTLTLDPAPPVWPDPDDYLPPDSDEEAGRE